MMKNGFRLPVKTRAILLAVIAAIAGRFQDGQATAAAITSVTFPSSPTLLVARPDQALGNRTMSASRGWFGQTVTAPSTFRLEQIVLGVTSANSNAAFEFGIWETSDVQAEARPSNTFPPTSSAPLSTSPLLGPLSLNVGSLSGNISLSIALDDNERIVLDELQGYFFGFRSTTGTDAFTFRQGSADPNLYPGGRIITNQNGIGDRDTALALNGTLVPEPSGVMVIGIGVASALLGWRRRTRPATAGLE